MNGLALALRLARREMRGGLRGFRVFLACLALGVATIAAVGSLGSAVKAGLERDARLLLGGDVELSLTHRAITDEQRRHLEASGALSSVIEMRGMARAGERRALVEIKAVDGAYPLVGAVTLRGGEGKGGEGDLAHALGWRDGAWGAVAEPATLARLGLTQGDRVSVGEASYILRGSIEAEPDRSANVFTLGPRLMVAADSLNATGLVQPGSLIRYQYRLLLGPTISAQDWIEELKQRFPAAGWRIRALAEAAPGLQRWIERIELLLILVGLTALLVGGVGVANAVRSYLDGKTQTIAILKCLGASGRLIVATYLAQVLALAGLGILSGLVLGAGAPALVLPLLTPYLPVPAQVGLYPLPLSIAAAFGALTALAFSLWPIGRAREVPPGALFRDLISPARRWPRPSLIGATALAVAALSALAVVTAVDRTLALVFVAAAIASVALFRAAALGIAGAARRAPRVSEPALRLALANIHRPGSPTPGIVLSLGLGLTVLMLVTLVQSNIVRQIRDQIPAIAPTFFFIDLQSNQVADFDRLMRDTPGVGEIRRVPSLRGRIARLNGVPVEQAPVAPEAQWAIGSDRGLTYAAQPPEGARVVAGQWWPADYAGPALVSLDARIAQGMGLGLGDTITLNVLGREIEARIANLRAIDWTTLGINFTLIFAPGTLEAAPHTFIATAEVKPGFEEAVERLVSERFANVSSIRVREALATMDRVLGAIAAAARATAAVTLLAGILVLAGAVAATHRRRVYDAVVLKVLGARRRTLIGAFAIEFALGGLATAALAAGVGTVAAYAFSRYLRLDFLFDVPAVAATALGATLVIVVLGLAGTWTALAGRPAPHLRNA